LAERIRKLSHYSLAIDESVDISDTAQLVAFVREVTEDLEVDEKLLGMASMKSKKTGENIAQEVLKIVQKFRLDPKKMSGLTTDGEPAKVEKHNGFITKCLKAFEAQSLVVNHCSIRQKHLRNKSLHAIDVMKEVVHCITFFNSSFFGRTRMPLTGYYVFLIGSLVIQGRHFETFLAFKRRLSGILPNRRTPAHGIFVAGVRYTRTSHQMPTVERRVECFPL